MCRTGWFFLALGGLLLFDAVLRAAPRTFLHDGAPYLIDVKEDDLPGNYVIAITQARDGYLWLGTLNGLVRFDGLQFTVYDESTTPALQANRIVYLFEDSKRRLWIGTETAGVVMVEEGRIKSFDIGKGSREGRLAAACEDRLGGVWLYTLDGQLWRYFSERIERFKTGGTEDYYSSRRILMADDAGRIWVGVDWGQFAFEPAKLSGPLELPVVEAVRAGEYGPLDGLLASRQGGYWRLATNDVQKWSGDRVERHLGAYPWGTARVTALCEDHQGHLIVGTRAGLFWFDSQDHATQLTPDHGLSSPYVLSLHVDAEGNLWVGTDGGGLNRIKRQVFDSLQHTAGWAVQSVSEDQAGGLWIGSIGTNGLAYWKDGQMERFAIGPVRNARAVFVDRTQRIWVGTLNGLFEWRGNEGQFQDNNWPYPVKRVVSAIFQDRSGELWFGTQAGLVHWNGQHWQSFSKTNGLSADDVQAIAEDKDGTLWVGTVGGGLNQLREGKFTVFDQEESLATASISALYFDHEGTLWIGTSGRGLVRLRGGTFTRITTQEGLNSNFISYLIEDDHGYLWVGSNRGVMRIPMRALHEFATSPERLIPVRVYGQPDGLPTPECSSGSQPGLCRSTNGVIWFPTIKGLASINPAQLKPNPLPPQVVIESVLVEGRPHGSNALRAPPLQAVKLSADQQRLEIKYTSLNLSAPERARFRYRLEGHENEWIEAGTSREARYSRLPPGHYRFRVTASNEDGVWNEVGCALDVTVEPPFWRTGWFVTLASLGTLALLVGLVYFFSTQRLHRQVQHLKAQEALERERARIARDIHDQVGASLTQVALLGELVESDKDAPEEIEAHARQISRTARETTRALDEIVWTVNPSNDTLEGLVNYVCKYAQDYLSVAGLQYRLDVPSQLPQVVIAPDVRHNVFLACKEAITNVVRHAQATAAHVRLLLLPSSFVLEIEDDGRGPADMSSPRAQTRSGLRNMRKRMEEIGGQFEMVPGAQRGTVVRLTVPISG